MALCQIRSLLFSAQRRNVLSAISSVRHSSRIELDHNKDSGLVTFTLSQPPVNSLSTEFLTDISDNLKKLNNDPDVKGILMTSKFHGKVFSSGLNILELYQNTDEKLNHFWWSVQEWYFDVFASPKPIVVAINGHAPAGGCAFSLMCDYRVMQEGKTIGLNETQLGISAPSFFHDIIIRALGRRNAELALLQGTMFSSEDALKAGMVDQVVPLDEVIPAATKVLKGLSRIPQPAYSMTKSVMRTNAIENLRNNRQADIDIFVKVIQNSVVQNAIGGYLTALKNRKK